MIRFHNISVDGVGTGAIDLTHTNGAIRFLLDILPDANMFHSSVTYEYNSTSTNTYGRRFNLVYEESHRSIESTGNTVVVTRKDNKLVKFLFSRSGNSRRLDSFAFEDKVTQFLYPNANTTNVLLPDGKIIRITHHNNFLTEILAPTRLGMQISTNGNNVILSEVSERGERQFGNNITITRPSNNNATVEDSRTGIRLVKTFSRVQSGVNIRDFDQEDLFIGDTFRQRTSEIICFATNRVQINYSFTHKRDISEPISLALFHNRVLSIQEAQNISNEFGRTESNWALSSNRFDNNFESNLISFTVQHFSPKKVQGSNGEIITKTVSKEFDHNMNGNLQMEWTIKNGIRSLTFYNVDRDGRVESIWDQGNNIWTELKYDNLGQLNGLEMRHAFNRDEKIIIDDQKFNKIIRKNPNYVAVSWLDDIKEWLVEKLESGKPKISINYKYDIWGRKEEIIKNNSQVLSIERLSPNQMQSIYPCGTKFEMGLNRIGKVTSIRKNGQEILNYSYDNQERLTDITDNNDWQTRTLIKYNNLGAISQIKQGDLTTIPFLNPNDNMEQISYVVDERPAMTYNFRYEHDRDNFLHAQTQTTYFQNSEVEKTMFDWAGRMSQRNDKIGETHLTYKIHDNQITGLIETYIDITGNTKYYYGSKEYDNDKIIKIDKEDVEKEYQYDAHGRLIRENARTFTYDDNGNVFFDQRDAGPQSRYEGSLLMEFNGQKFQYDKLGNPTIYRDKKLEWDFKNLRQFDQTRFTYTADGLRTTKTHDNIVHQYYWAGDRLISEKRTTVHTDFGAGPNGQIPEGGFVIPDEGIYLEENHQYIDYIYGSTGVIGFTVQNDNAPVQKYWYVKNAQGDVVQIVDENKNVVAKYCYDAWGNCTILENVDGIAELNAIRYRSYYFDSETNLYYLRTRYYDPEICRFISPDNIGVLEITKNMVNGLNLYAYCGNNPTMYVDPDGKFPIPLFILKAAKVVGKTIFVSSIGGGITATIYVMNAIGTGVNLGAEFVGGFVNGFISTFGMSLALITGSLPLGMLVSGSFGFAGGTLGNATTQFINNNEIDWDIAMVFGGVNALTNAVAFILPFQLTSSRENFSQMLAGLGMGAVASAYLGSFSIHRILNELLGK